MGLEVTKSNNFDFWYESPSRSRRIKRRIIPTLNSMPSDRAPRKVNPSTCLWHERRVSLEWASPILSNRNSDLTELGAVRGMSADADHTRNFRFAEIPCVSFPLMLFYLSLASLLKTWNKSKREIRRSRLFSGTANYTSVSTRSEKRCVIVATKLQKASIYAAFRLHKLSVVLARCVIVEMGTFLAHFMCRAAAAQSVRQG